RFSADQGQGSRAECAARRCGTVHYRQSRGGPVTMKRLCIAACLLVFVDGLQIRPTRVGADEPKPTVPATVPFELLETKHMAVKIKLNGKGPYRVIFDTGAPVT